LVNIVFIILATSYFRDLHNTAAYQYEGAFINNHVPFNLYRNIVLPDVGMGILIYCAYLSINLFTLRRFLSPKKYQTGTSKIFMAV